jgi:sugar/nucleoside kinase (ribokinase family)
MTILTVGSVAFDDIKTPKASAKRLLGGSATYFSLAASYLAPVRIIAVVGEDFSTEDESILTDRGVCLAGLERASGETFYYSGEYHLEISKRTTHFTKLGVFENFSPKIPEHYKESPYLFLGNIAPKIQMEVLSKIKRPKLVGADTMNFWIEGDPQGLAQVMSNIDILIINDSEAKQLTGEINVVGAGEALVKRGPRFVVIKKGEHGADLFNEGSYFSIPSFPISAVTDPTGAGDSFAGGFMGHLAASEDYSEGNLRKAMAVGTVMSSFCVEQFGVAGLLHLTPDDFYHRFRELRKCSQYSELDINFIPHRS